MKNDIITKWSKVLDHEDQYTPKLNPINRECVAYQCEFFDKAYRKYLELIDIEWDEANIEFCKRMIPAVRRLEGYISWELSNIDGKDCVVVGNYLTPEFTYITLAIPILMEQDTFPRDDEPLIDGCYTYNPKFNQWFLN